MGIRELQESITDHRKTSEQTRDRLKREIITYRNNQSISVGSLIKKLTAIVDSRRTMSHCFSVPAIRDIIDDLIEEKEAGIGPKNSTID